MKELGSELLRPMGAPGAWRHTSATKVWYRQCGGEAARALGESRNAAGRETAPFLLSFKFGASGTDERVDGRASGVDTGSSPTSSAEIAIYRKLDVCRTRVQRVRHERAQQGCDLVCTAVRGGGGGAAAGDRANDRLTLSECFCGAVLPAFAK